MMVAQRSLTCRFLRSRNASAQLLSRCPFSVASSSHRWRGFVFRNSHHFQLVRQTRKRARGCPHFCAMRCASPVSTFQPSIPRASRFKRAHSKAGALLRYVNYGASRSRRTRKATKAPPRTLLSTCLLLRIQPRITRSITRSKTPPTSLRHRLK